MDIQYDQNVLGQESPDGIRALLMRARTALAKRPLEAGDIIDRAVELLSFHTEQRSRPADLLKDWTLTQPLAASGPMEGAGAAAGAIAEHVSGSAPSPAPSTPMRFRRYTVLPGSRLLLRDGRELPLGSRAFDLLCILLERRGRIVCKQEIDDRVWPSTLVQESNLRFQMACLRRALGSDRDVIKTIPGRGYFLVLEPDAAAEGGERTNASIEAGGYAAGLQHLSTPMPCPS